MELNEFRAELSRLLAAAGCRLTESDVRRITKECRDEIYAEALSSGTPLESPFFHFVSLDGIALFTFFESPFALFILPCVEHALIGETNQIALLDTHQCRDLLRTKYDKVKPDLEIPRTVAELWLA
jgi:hypothetical protein